MTAFLTLSLGPHPRRARPIFASDDVMLVRAVVATLIDQLNSNGVPFDLDEVHATSCKEVTNECS